MGKTIVRLSLTLKKTNQNNWPDPDRRQEGHPVALYH